MKMGSGNSNERGTGGESYQQEPISDVRQSQLRKQESQTHEQHTKAHTHKFQVIMEED